MEMYIFSGAVFLVARIFQVKRAVDATVLK